MANNLSAEFISEIRKRAADGSSLRKISRDLGVSVNTVSKYAKGYFGLCKCGQPAGHKGWCVERYKASEARQAYHAKRKGITLPVRQQPKRSRQQEQKEEKRLWLKMPRNMANPLPYSLHIRAVGDVNYACRKLVVAERDDVIQHMILSVIDGFLDFEDIPRAIPSFVGYHRQDFQIAFSLNSGGSNAMEYLEMVSSEDATSKWNDLHVGVGSRRERVACD